MRNHDWSTVEIKFLKKNYDVLSAKKIAEVLNRTPESVYGQARYQGLIKKDRWTDEQVQFLKDNYGSMSLKQIANALDMYVIRVASKAHTLKLYPELKKVS